MLTLKIASPLHYWNPIPFGGISLGQELTCQNEILEIGNASGVLSPAEYLAVFSQTFAFSKIWFKFCLEPLLLENHMYFLTNLIWMFLIFLPFSSLKHYVVGLICLGSNLILLENLWKPLLLGWEAKLCLILGVYIQSELEHYRNFWIRGSQSGGPRPAPSLSPGQGPSH